MQCIASAILWFMRKFDHSFFMFLCIFLHIAESESNQALKIQYYRTSTFLRHKSHTFNKRADRTSKSFPLHECHQYRRIWELHLLLLMDFSLRNNLRIIEVQRLTLPCSMSILSKVALGRKINSQAKYIQ